MSLSGTSPHPLSPPPLPIESSEHVLGATGPGTLEVYESADE